MSIDTPESPLQMIRVKEREIARQISAARERASERIQSAEAEADRLRAAADRTGSSEAQSMLKAAICQAETDAEAIRQAAETEATHLRERGTPVLARAAALIVGRVLPIAAELEEWAVNSPG
jgi:vacuolar-type H+-ATPase subunit H